MPSKPSHTTHKVDTIQTEELEKLYEVAPDRNFKVRSVNEYNRVRQWTRKKLSSSKLKILDFGCGEGIAASSFALRHPNHFVRGCDIQLPSYSRLAASLKQQVGLELPPNLDLFQIKDTKDSTSDRYDLIYSWSVMEHIKEPDLPVIADYLRSRLEPDGILFIQVNPLYFSSRGSHLAGILKPWEHLVLTIDEIRQRLDPNIPGKERAWKQFVELNRLLADDIISHITSAGLKCVRRQYFQEETLPPERLSRIYSHEALMTNEFIALFSPL